MQVREIPVAELLTHGRALFEANHLEAGHVPSAGFTPRLDINDRTFIAMERAGVLLTIGLYTSDDVLVGYTVSVVARHHFVDEIVCSVLTIFVDKNHRRNGNASALMDATEALAFERGAASVNWHAHDYVLERLLQSRGARQLEVIYAVRK